MINKNYKIVSSLLMIGMVSCTSLSEKNSDTHQPSKAVKNEIQSRFSKEEIAKSEDLFPNNTDSLNTVTGIFSGKLDEGIDLKNLDDFSNSIGKNVTGKIEYFNSFNKLYKVNSECKLHGTIKDYRISSDSVLLDIKFNSFNCENGFQKKLLTHIVDGDDSFHGLRIHLNNNKEYTKQKNSKFFAILEKSTISN